MTTARTCPSPRGRASATSRAWRVPAALAAGLALLVAGQVPATASSGPADAHAAHPERDTGSPDPEPGADVGSVPAWTTPAPSTGPRPWR